MRTDPTLVSFEIQDDLAEAALGAIEVHLRLSDGIDRWCFFMTPEALAACGDYLPGTRTRFHVGVLHMFVVSDISEEVVGSLLAELEQRGELVKHTRRIADS